VSSPNAEAVRNSLAAWNRGDVDAWLEASHPDIEWTSEIAQAIEGSQRVYRGPEEMRKFWNEWHAVWALTIEVSEVRELGDTVVALARVRARGQASGITFDRPIAYVFEFEDGLVRRARSYFDIERALKAAGMAD
jgi:ketosteroid isomerase-like protein